MNDFTLIEQPKIQEIDGFYHSLCNGYIQLADLLIKEDIEKVKEAVETIQNLERFLDSKNLIDWY